MVAIYPSLVLAYHLQGDGLVERLNRTVMESLAKFVDR